jgi:DNA (cytosine-5)-methyltransferase 1
MSGLKAISLFTGAGGLDYGFEAAGFSTAVAVEMDKRCCETLRHNSRWSVIDRDINAVSTKELLRAGSLRPEQADMLIGGPPCQPFSKSGFWATGDAKRLDDPRATTMEAYLRVLAEARPRAFLLENVEGLGFKGKDEGLKLIQRRLTAINEAHFTDYRASIGILNAADYGVPQLRKRIFVVGARDGANFEFPTVTHRAADELDWTADCTRHLTAWDALHDLAEPNDHEVALKGKWADLLPTIPEGANYLWHTDRGGGEPLFGWRRRYWSFLLKLAKNLPAWTIQAQPGPATGPFHWNNRRLTMREMARLQTFPDDIDIVGSLADAQRQLGNAVPSLMAEVLARAIADQLLGIPSSTAPLKLSIKPAQEPPPAAAPPRPVPLQFLKMRGEHKAHPGTGKGSGALARTLVASE